MKKVITTGILFLVFIAQLSFAQNEADRIDQLIKRARVKYDVPGLSVAVVKDGQVLLSRGYGTLETGRKQYVDEKTLFAIASNTKGFLSTAIAILVSEGKIRWDDKVVDYLPYFKLYDPYVTKEVTIADLLSHRVGLGTFSGDAIWYKSELPAEEIVRLAANVPQAYSFRAGYGYSNLMFITAGEVIKAVTGKPWDRYVNEKILDPLQMDRTVTSVRKLDQAGNYATPHKTSPSGNKSIRWVNWDNMSAAGAIISSADDMAKWMIMHLNEGSYKGKNILDKKEQNTLWTIHNSRKLSEDDRSSVAGRHFTGYGLGFGLQDYHGRLMISHGGGYDGMYSRVAMLADDKIGVAILTNSMSGISTPLSYAIINELINEDKKDWITEMYSPPVWNPDVEKLKNSRKTGTTPALKSKAYAGSYDADLYGEITVRDENGILRLYFSHSPDLSATLEHWHYNTFQIKWDETHAWFDFGLVTFELDDNLEVTGMKMNVPNGDIFFDEYTIVRK